MDTSKIETFSDTNANDPALVKFRQKVEVVGDDTLADTKCHVGVDLADNSTREAKYDLSDAHDPQGQSEALRHKGRGLVGEKEPALWNATAHQVDVDALFELMKR